MNRLENWFCASALWRSFTRRRLLPWVLEGAGLGEHVLEVGAGFGAATEELQRRTPRLTSLEYAADSVTRLAARRQGTSSGVVRGDAAALPFPDATFSSVVAILVLHHLRSLAAQDRAFAEIHRVLRPGGVFLAFEISDSWIGRLAHIRSTFVPVDPAGVRVRLAAAGFSRVTVDFQRSAFRLRALRAAQAMFPGEHSAATA
ncbi:MAG: class I SAM-dependent methyltransferase [Acidobacteriia bacterium]|nr:class I SAM-dependent methyltransferase [Terriglobia bacterium]